MKRLYSVPNIVIIGLISFLSIPLIYLILSGLFDSPFLSQWNAPSLLGFSEILKDSSLLHSLSESILLALVSATVGVALSTFHLSDLLFNHKRESEWSAIALSFPLVMPDIIWGLAIVFFAKAFTIGLGYNWVFLVHVCFNVVLSYVFLKPVFESYPKSQIRSSLVLGASRFTTLIDVILPNLKKQILAIFVMCFLYSYDDFLLTFLIGGSDTDTLPLYLYSKLRYGASSSIVSIASATTIFNVLMSVIILWASRKQKSWI